VTKDVGSLDRVLRIVLGLALIAYAIPIEFPNTGWNSVGWIGVIPLLTAVFSTCPAYGLLGVNTCAKP